LEEVPRRPDIYREIVPEIFRIPCYQLGRVDFCVGSDQKVGKYSPDTFSPLSQIARIELPGSLRNVQRSWKASVDPIYCEKSLDAPLFTGRVRGKMYSRVEFAVGNVGHDQVLTSRSCPLEEPSGGLGELVASQMTDQDACV